MPEAPDLNVYREHLQARVLGEVLKDVRLHSPFVLRSVVPGLEEMRGRKVRGVRRLAKQIVFELSDDHFMVIHLMIAGRLHWREDGGGRPGRNGLAVFEFSTGVLTFTEASKTRRASLRFVHGRAALAALDPGGLDVMQADEGVFAARLRGCNHTLKRALTDQRVLAGIGNAYSDEILHRAGMSPFKRAGALNDQEVSRLYEVCRFVIDDWTQRLRQRAGGKFPTKVTAFHKEMAVHGKYRQPCPVCGAPVQRVVYAENEANYCAGCQTGGRLLADRSLSRLLKDNWPKRLEDLEGGFRGWPSGGSMDGVDRP